MTDEERLEHFAKMFGCDSQAELEDQIDQAYYNFMAALAFASVCSAAPDPTLAVRNLLNQIRDSVMDRAKQQASERETFCNTFMGQLFGSMLGSEDDVMKQYQEAVNTTHAQLLPVITKLARKLQ